MTRPRVVHVGKYFWPRRGGVENHLYHLCRRLNVHVDLRVIASNTEPTRVDEVYDGIRVTRLPLRATVAGMPISPSLVGELRRAEADIVHFHVPNPCAEAACLLARPNARLVSFYHHDVVQRPLLWPAYRCVARRFLQRNRRLIASAPENIRYSRLIAAFADRACVIPLGIEPGDFEPTPERERLAREIRSRYGAPLVFFMGRHVRSKGVHVLIRAMKDVEAHLLVGSRGPMTPELRALARAMGIAHRVHFAGDIPDEALAATYAAADVFCLPSISRVEAFGIVQIEAMAAGVPVVSTRLTTGVVYANLDGRTGLTVPPGDADALASALRTLLGDDALRRRLGTQARERVNADFTHEVCARRTLALYADVLTDR